MLLAVGNLEVYSETICAANATSKLSSVRVERAFPKYFRYFFRLQVPFIDRRQISRDHRSVCRQVPVAQMYASVSASYPKALVGSYRTYQQLPVI
jgi:hypothetical protein